MAQLDIILTPDSLLQTETVTAGAVGTAVEVGERKMFAVSIDRACFIEWGTTSAVTASTSTTLLPGAGIYTFFSGNRFSWVELFAPAGTNAITSIFSLANN